MSVAPSRSSSCPSRSPSSTHVREIFAQFLAFLSLSEPMRAGFVLLAMCCMSEATRCSCAALVWHVGWQACRVGCSILPCILKSLLPFCLRIPMPGSMSELGPDFPIPSRRRLLTAEFALQFAAKNLLASSAEHLPIIPSRHSSPRTPRPERTNTAQMGGFLHSQCRPGASTHDPLSISAH